ncbi:hypothetical protein N9089_03005 [Crocinitomicaceae bacterium]|nr:hypothetical protein [Crocinitomicaceae bacterium]
MKDAFENSLKENLENFELPYDASAWASMQSKLDATAAAGSNGFDKQVKESLSSNEYPYNPAAWTAMSKKLDAKKGGKGKWYIAASILAIASVTAYLVLTNETERKQDQNGSRTAQSVDATSVKTNPNEKRNTNTSKATLTSENQEKNAANQNEVVSKQTTSTNQTQPSGTNTAVNAINNANNANNSGNNNLSNNNASPNNPIVTVIPTDPNGENTTRPVTYISPEIGNVCLGTITKIKNYNEFPLVIVNPNGQVWTSAENTKTPFNPTVDGTHRLGYMKKNRFIEKERFSVNPTPKADFEFVDLSKKFLDGMPSTEVRTSSVGQSFTWSYENGTEYGTEAELHFYKKGVHVIELTVVGATGCESTVTKTVNIDENYNLMANTGFYPMGIDPRTNSFMPYSLTKRDVQFTMIILDPNDGHLIYETSDASKGWDGIDRQTGSLVQMEKAYIWKVNLSNPEKGESSEYAGTIMPLAK